MTAEARDAVIELQGVSKRFSETVAVDNVSLSLKEGEFFALLGPSGCGKTTLLRMLAGFERPDGGAILLDGKDITETAANRRPLNMMFQSYALFPHMTVRANVSYGLEMERLGKSEIDRRIGEILEITQLDTLGDRKPGELSGGQRQRVALARALVKQPRVLLLDEPLAALDKKLREQMQVELKRLQEEFAITFVVVTHDQEEALVMADRIGLMRDGQIVQVADPQSLYNQPANRFVAGFIGQSNFITGIVTANGLEHQILGSLSALSETGPDSGQQGVIAIRPERLHITDSRYPARDNAVQGIVTDTAYHGQSVTVTVNVDGLDQDLAANIPIVQLDSAQFSNGQSVWCQWDQQHGRLLHAD